MSVILQSKLKNDCLMVFVLFNNRLENKDEKEFVLLHACCIVYSDIVYFL